MYVCMRYICCTRENTRMTEQCTSGRSTENGECMSREQIWELEENKRILLRQAYRMKQEHPHMSPVGLEHEMYLSIMAEVHEITARLQNVAEA